MPAVTKIAFLAAIFMLPGLASAEERRQETSAVSDTHAAADQPSGKLFVIATSDQWAQNEGQSTLPIQLKERKICAPQKCWP